MCLSVLYYQEHPCYCTDIIVIVGNHVYIYTYIHTYIHIYIYIYIYIYIHIYIYIYIYRPIYIYIYIYIYTKLKTILVKERICIKNNPCWMNMIYEQTRKTSILLIVLSVGIYH